MSQRRPHHSARSPLALILGLAALRVAIVALVIVALVGSAKEPRDVHPQRYRAVLLPTLPDEPPAQDIMGPSTMVESESEETAQRPDRGAAHTETPWYGLCPLKSVASLDDFRRVVRSDQRLAAYYGSFNWARARLVTTAEPQLVYVSYQKAGALARTKHPMLLPKGDTLLTDGVLQARTYCCNEVFEIVDAPLPPPSEGDQPAWPLPPSTQVLWPPESPPALAPPEDETPPAELVAPPVAPPFSPPSARGEMPPSSLVAPPAAPPFSPPSTRGDVPPLELATPPTVPTFPPPPSPGEIPPSSLLAPPVAIAFPPLPDSFPAPVPVPSFPSPLALPPTTTVVPEPSTVTLLSLGLTGLVWCRWRAWRRARRAALASRACTVSVTGRAAS